MPTVSDLLDTIQDLALVGSGNSADDARVMRYMNLVYKEVYRRTAQQRPTLLLTSETVNITSGSGTMAATPFSVSLVKDTGNDNNKLKPTTLPELEDEYPALDDTGAPAWFYFTSGTAIKTYPVNSTTLSVRYVPSVGTLTTTSAEADIKIPPEFHDVLLWGTLVYMAYDERDKSMSGEVNTAQSKYEIALADYQSWLMYGQTKATTTTEVVFGG